jgi:hypothetical protein
VRVEHLIGDAIDNRLAEGDFIPGQLGKPRTHAADEVLLGFAGWPRGVGAQHHARLHVRWCPRVGAVVVAADMRYDGCDLGKVEDDLAQLGIHF